MICLLLLACTLSTTACKRKLSLEETKVNLEKAMTNHLQDEQPGIPLKFQMVDVDYFEDVNFYECEFKVKLHRADGSDTTGLIKGRISKDFSRVTKK
jgi:hypothetical protein